jgi:hypothetical protein
MDSAEFELKWEAIHEDPAEFGGSLVDTEKGEAFLFYPGSARRRGLLAWQSVEIQSAAEVLCVRFRSDEPLWSAELGKDADLSKVPGDEIYSSLQIKALGYTAQRLLVAYRMEESMWVLHGLNRADGSICWSETIQEPQASHVSKERAALVVANQNGKVSILDANTGTALSTLPVEVEALDATWCAGGLMVAGPDGVTSVYSTEGLARWECRIQVSETDSIADRVVDGNGTVILASNGEIRGVAQETGESVWRQEGPDANHIAIADLQCAFVLQDLTNNKSQLHRSEDGTPVPVEGFEKLLHWIGGAGEVLAVTVEGVFARIDLESGTLSEADPLGEDIRLFDLVRKGSRLYATAITNPESPMLLLEINGEGTSIHRQIELPLAEEIKMEVTAANEVVISSPVGVLIYG